MTQTKKEKVIPIQNYTVHVIDKYGKKIEMDYRDGRLLGRILISFASVVILAYTVMTALQEYNSERLSFVTIVLVIILSCITLGTFVAGFIEYLNRNKVKLATLNPTMGELLLVETGKEPESIRFSRLGFKLKLVHYKSRDYHLIVILDPDEKDKGTYRMNFGSLNKNTRRILEVLKGRGLTEMVDSFKNPVPTEI